MGANLSGAFFCIRRAFAPMRGEGGGRIVHLSSLSGVYATEKFPGLTAYNASKSGLVGLAEGAARTAGPTASPSRASAPVPWTPTCSVRRIRT